MKSGRHIASIWEALGSVVAPLAAMGCFFSDSDCNNSAQKRPKDHICGFVKIVIFLCVCWCFERLTSPSGRPNGCLETFLEHLATHGGHFGDICGAYLCHGGVKCAFGPTFGDLFSVVCG